MRTKVWGAALIAAMMLTTACGGGSGSAPSPVVAAPTPPPAPTPTPTPTPTSLTRAFGASATPCFVYLYATAARDSNDASFSGFYCSREGTFGPGISPLRTTSFGPRYVLDADRSFISIVGVESAGATLVIYQAPLGSRIFSPLTSILDAAGGQAAVKGAFGLDDGLFSLAADRDLTTFDTAAALGSSDEALRREGARLVAANLRASAVASGVATVRSGQYDPYDLIATDYREVGRLIGSNARFLFENSVMSQLLQGVVPAARYRADVVSAAAHLIDAYAAAIGVQVADTASAAQFTLGIPGYLQPELAALLQANTAEAAASAEAVTAQTILDRTSPFRDTLPFPTTGFFYPSPNFFVAAPGTTLAIQSSNDQGRPSIASFDAYANGPTGSIGFFGSIAQVLSVSVSPTNAARIYAVLEGDTIKVSAVASTSGTSYFDYTVRRSTGEEGVGRVYVTFR